MNDNPETTDDGFDIKAIINGKRTIFIDGKCYKFYLNPEQELINILEIEQTRSEKPVTEMFRENWKRLQEFKVSDDVTSVSIVYNNNKIYVQLNAPIEP